jgi:hypothetical protein
MGLVMAMASGARIGVGTFYPLSHRIPVPAFVCACVDVPSHEVHRDTGIGWLEPGDQGNSGVADFHTLLEGSASIPGSWGSHCLE